MILKPQNKKHLEDIRSFYKLKNLGINLYSKRYENEPNQIENWFTNDISGFMNNNLPIMYGYVEKYYDILFRLKNIKDKQTIISFSINLIKGSSKREINVLFGLLTTNERIDMLSYYFSENEINTIIQN